MLVVTLGDRGCDVYRAGEPTYHSAAFKSGTEVDPTGAGDVFYMQMGVRFSEGWTAPSNPSTTTTSTST